MFKVNNGNTKLGKSIKVINVPAGITCKCDAPCNKKGVCYAQKGSFNYPSVKNCYAENLRTFIENPEQAEMDILSQMPFIGFCRVHASGDIVNPRYLDMLVSIAIKLPNVKFMMYTKKYELINKYVEEIGEFPENMTIIFSAWDGYKMDNRHNFPTSHVILKKGNEDAIPENGFLCNGECERCYKCWLLEKGESVLFNEH